MNYKELFENLQKDVESADQAKKFPKSKLKFEIGSEVVLRFVPIQKSLPLQRYKYVEWDSKLNGNYVFGGRSPFDPFLPKEVRLKKEDCFYDKAMWESWKVANSHKDDVVRKDAVKKAFSLAQKEKGVVMVYVVKHSKQPELEGTVEPWLFRAGEKEDKKTKVKSGVGEVYEVLYDAMFGDEKDDIGFDGLFNLGKDGYSVRLKIEQKSIGTLVIPSYKLKLKRDDLNLNQEDQERIIGDAEEANILQYIPEVFPQDKIKKLLNEHWYGKSPLDETEDEELDDETEDEDDIPMDYHDTNKDSLSKDEGKEEEDDFNF